MSSPNRWHVSARVDLAAYAFSWVWVFVPLMFVTGIRPNIDYVWLFVITIVVTDIHRHAAIPYVYGDSQVFRQHPVRFVVFPLAMLAAFFGALYLLGSKTRIDPHWLFAVVGAAVVLMQVVRRDRGNRFREGELRRVSVPAAVVTGIVWLVGAAAPGLVHPALAWLAGLMALSLLLDRVHRAAKDAPRPRYVAPIMLGLLLLGAWLGADSMHAAFPRGVPGRWLVTTAGVIVAVWNVWHVLMQKYGILRLYSAKSGNEAKVPGWVDRLLLFSWLPLWVAWITPRYLDVAIRRLRGARGILVPVGQVVDFVMPVLMPASVVLVVASIVLFVVHERRANGLRNVPRLSMAAGTVLLSCTFLLLHPIKGYVCWGFSHAIEYLVFVWAFQRKRYAKPLDHSPPLGRVLLRYPIATYAVYMLVTTAVFFGLRHWGFVVFKDMPKAFVGPFSSRTLVAQWGVYQAMMHFYFDGFLWKMRLPSVRRHI